VSSCKFCVSQPESEHEYLSFSSLVWRYVTYGLRGRLKYLFVPTRNSVVHDSLFGFDVVF